jgi:hypothetical protein
MNVTLAVLADYADFSVEGKLNIMGIFNVSYAQSLPMQHPPMHKPSILAHDPPTVCAKPPSLTMPWSIPASNDSLHEVAQ